MLTKPMGLIIKSGKRNLRVKAGIPQLLTKRPEQVVIRNEFTGAGFTIHTDVTVEFDGMVRLDWGISTTKPLDVDSLMIEISMPTSIAGYLYDFPGKWGEIDNSGAEFQIQGRTLHTPKFGTPSGKAVMHVHTLPQLKGNPGQWRLMTVRSEGQFNTVVYEEEDLYRGQTRRDVVLVHPDDIERFGLPSGKRVRVASEIGELEVLLQPFARIKPGNALMYFPESNESPQ